MKYDNMRGHRLFLLLTSLFVAALVVCNLIANKFVTVDLGFLGFQEAFIISAGVLPYPVTFLITDLLSEFYGRKRTNWVVASGLLASTFILAVLWLGNQFPAIDNSPVNDGEYAKMFGNSWRVIGASMTAYVVAQFADVRLYHFWKGLTKGKHLWLRNNGSTIISQLLDTTLVVAVLFAGVQSTSFMLDLVLDGWLFKAMCALLDTPLIYAASWFIRQRYGLALGEELPSIGSPSIDQAN